MAPCRCLIDERLPTTRARAKRSNNYRHHLNTQSRLFAWQIFVFLVLLLFYSPKKPTSRRQRLDLSVLISLPK